MKLKKSKIRHVKKPMIDKLKLNKPTVYDPEFKKTVVSFAEKKGNKEARRLYGVPEYNIRRWRGNPRLLTQKQEKSIAPKKENDTLDSMPLEQRLKGPTTTPGTVLTPPTEVSAPEQVLQSQPLSPTKLKVTRHVKPSAPSPIPPPPPPPIEEVCLKWNSHHSNLQHTFPNLLLREQYVDATLVAEGQTLKCHRVILSSCSPYFEDVLASISPYQHPVLFMKDVPFWILKCLCDFMYSGEVHILQTRLEELLAIAETLKIKGLAGQSDTKMIDTKPEFTIPIKEEKLDEKEREKEIKKKEEKELRRKEEKEVKKKEEKEVKKKEEKEIKKREEKEFKKKEEKDIKKKEELKLPDNKLSKKREEKDVVKREEKQTKKKEDMKEIKEKKRVTVTPSPERPVVKCAKIPKAVIQSPVPILRNKSKSLVESKKREKKLEKEKASPIEKIPITKNIPSTSSFSNPFGLLKPVYEEVTQDPQPNKVAIVKDTKNVNVKRTLQKKVKKRKLTDEREESPPPTLSRKGTRSRPRTKVAKYFHPAPVPSYDQSTIVREPHTDQADSFVQIQDIKSEPLYDDSIEIEDNLVGFSESSVSVEEQLIGSYDTTFKNFGRRSTRRSKPIIMDVQSLASEIDGQHILKIVNVAELKANNDPLEDPLGLNQSSSDSASMVEQTDNTLGFRISKVVTEKEDSQSSDVCREMGFKIASIVSQQEEDRKLEQATTKIEASYEEEEQEFNEFDDATSQNEDQKPILQLIETEDSNSNPLGKPLIQKLIKENQHIEETASSLQIENSNTLNKDQIDIKDDKGLISLPGNISYKIKEELITENEHQFNNEEENILDSFQDSIHEEHPLTEQIHTVHEPTNDDQIVGIKTIKTSTVASSQATVPNEEKLVLGKNQFMSKTISIIQEAYLPDEISMDTCTNDVDITFENYGKTSDQKSSTQQIDNLENITTNLLLTVQGASTSSNLQIANVDELHTSAVNENSLQLHTSASQTVATQRNETLDCLEMNEVCHQNIDEKCNVDVNDDYQMEDSYKHHSDGIANTQIDDKDTTEYNSEIIDNEMCENFVESRHSVPKSQFDEVKPMEEDYVDENSFNTNVISISELNQQVVRQNVESKDVELNEVSNKLDPAQVAPSFNKNSYVSGDECDNPEISRPNLASFVENPSIDTCQGTGNIGPEAGDTTNPNVSQIVDSEPVIVMNKENCSNMPDISIADNKQILTNFEEEISSNIPQTELQQPIYDKESSSNVAQSKVPSCDENQPLGHCCEESSNTVSHDESHPVCYGDNYSNITQSTVQPCDVSLYDENQHIDNSQNENNIGTSSQQVSSHDESIDNSYVESSSNISQVEGVSNIQNAIYTEEMKNLPASETVICNENQLIDNSYEDVTQPQLAHNKNQFVNEINSSNIQYDYSENKLIEENNDDFSLTKLNSNKIVPESECLGQENQLMETDDADMKLIQVQSDENDEESNSQLLQHDQQTVSLIHGSESSLNCPSESESYSDKSDGGEIEPLIPFSTDNNIKSLDNTQKEFALVQQIPSSSENISNVLVPISDNHLPYKMYDDESSSNVRYEINPFTENQDRPSDFHLQAEEIGRSNEPGFHIAQVISEQIAEIEGSRVNEQFVINTCSVNEQCENKVSNSNELESIVDDLSRIVGRSCEESNILHTDDTNSIADSLENLLQK